jgi:hypothetical protein
MGHPLLQTRKKASPTLQFLGSLIVLESYKYTRVLIFLYILHFTQTFKDFN